MVPLEEEPKLVPQKPSEEIIVEDEPTFNTETVYTFKNVLFEFDKTELLSTSTQELDALYFYLKNNTNLTVEIYGHTDNQGTDSYNETLSNDRAKAVSDYLILKGLAPNRVSWIGFGSSKSIATNKTEAGRAQNRRVEFKLVKSSPWPPDSILKMNRC